MNTDLIRTIVLRVNGKAAEDRLNKTHEKISAIKKRLEELNQTASTRPLTTDEDKEFAKLTKELF